MTSVSFESMRLVATYTLSKRSFFCQYLLILTLKSVHSTSIAGGFLYLYNKTLNISVQPNVSYYGDESSIIRLVSLLLENAMKYSDDEGTVSLKFCTNGKNKVLSVKNTVAEIQKGKLDMLFDRFYRIDKSRNSQTGGFGIGLSVAKAIVNAHKGKITAVSSDGKSIEITAVL